MEVNILRLIYEIWQDELKEEKQTLNSHQAQTC
jgi:hypothetical protein